MKELHMKIVAVNTGEYYAQYLYTTKHPRPLEGPWNFDYIEMQYVKFLIEIDEGKVAACYNIVRVYEDISKGMGVMFELTKCSPLDEADIRAFVKGMNLCGFSQKKLY
jgi:hypothetical protein